MSCRMRDTRGRENIVICGMERERGGAEREGNAAGGREMKSKGGLPLGERQRRRWDRCGEQQRRARNQTEIEREKKEEYVREEEGVLHGRPSQSGTSRVFVVL